MRYSVIERIRSARFIASVPAVLMVMSLAFSAGTAQAQVKEASTGQSPSVLDPNALAKVTGGGTVLAKPTFMTTVASFGLNARRPVGFSGGETAEGRIEYDRHRNMTDRKVNVPVVLMDASPVPMPPNETGGDALLIGDCHPTQGSATCPSTPTTNSVIVYVKDVTDSGAGQDIFNIYFCSGAPSPVTGFVPGAPIPDCQGPEGDTLRSGNIQVRGDAAVVGETIASAAGSGSYTMTPDINGVELSGGTFGLGLRTAGPGDLEANLNGVQPLIGIFQQLTVSGWVTSASLNGGTMTFSGTASLDMGDGSAPLTGLALSGSVTATGVSLTVGSWSLGTLPLQDGFITIE